MSKDRRVWFVVGVVLILLLVAMPKYRAVIVKSRESTLAVNLGSLREVIKQYTKDKAKAPQSLQELVDAGYFRELPMDPMNNSRAWEPVRTEAGIIDVHSVSTSISSKGTSYNTW
jgi:general secretion pathway protein G